MIKHVFHDPDVHLIRVTTDPYQLTIHCQTALQRFSINDFKKMIRVIKGVLDSDEYYEYLSAWEQIIADKRFTIHEKCEKEDRTPFKNERNILDRLAKLDKFLDNQISDLPEWAYVSD